MTVPSFDLLMQLWELNFEGDIIPAHKTALIFFVAENIKLYGGEGKFIDLFDTLFGLDIKIHVVIINRQSVIFRLSYGHGLSPVSVYFRRRFVFGNKSVNSFFDSVITQILEIWWVFRRLLCKILSKVLNIIIGLEYILIDICLFGLNSLFILCRHWWSHLFVFIFFY